MKAVLLDGRSGLAGNLWMSAMIGLGANPGIAVDLPEILNFPGVKIDSQIRVLAADPRVLSVQLLITGADQTEAESWGKMEERLLSADAPSSVIGGAREVLLRRQEAESRGLGLALEDRIFSGAALADTLIDVLGGIWLWHDLGEPQVMVRGPLNIGHHPPPAVIEILDFLPVNQGDQEPEMTTPTGAALLEYCWEPLCEFPAAAEKSVRVEAAFSLAGRAMPLQAELYEI